MADRRTKRLLLYRSSSFVPTQLSGLALWYDSADVSSITLNSGNVAQWDDKSGNSRHLVQGSGSLQPAYGTQTQNGSPLVVTNAVGLTRLQSGNYAMTDLWGASRQTGTLFQVYKYISGTVIGGFHDQATSFTDSVLFRPTAINQFRHGSVNDDAVGGYGLTLPTGNMDDLIHVVNLATPTVQVYRNGSLVSTLTPSATTGFTSGTNQFYRINWDASGTTAYHAEHIHYNRVLDAGEIAQVRSYLTAKWGL